MKYRYPHQTKTTVDRAKELAFSTETWKGLCYLVSKLAVGIISFTLCIVFVTVPLAMILSPISVLFFGSDMEIWFFGLDDYQISAMFCMLGLLFAPLCARGISAVAWLNAAWAKLWLSRR